MRGKKSVLVLKIKSYHRLFGSLLTAVLLTDYFCDFLSVLVIAFVSWCFVRRVSQLASFIDVFGTLSRTFPCKIPLLFEARNTLMIPEITFPM